MEIYIGADYRGFEKKKEILKFLAKRTDKTIDAGAYSYSEGDDFNEPAVRVAKAVRNKRDARGILLCGSAHGATIQANRFKGIRAANCDSEESAKLAREHDNANVLCLSAELIDEEKMKKIIKAFLETDFISLERRVRRINRLDEREDYD